MRRYDYLWGKLTCRICFQGEDSLRSLITGKREREKEREEREERERTEREERFFKVKESEGFREIHENRAI
jgi:hypothetical protein